MIFGPPNGLEVQVISVDGVTMLVFSWSTETEREDFAPIAARLSRAELAVLEGIRAGKSNAEIASARGVSVRTVANQAASLFDKVGVHSRSELLVRLFSRRHGRGKERMDSTSSRRVRVPQRSG